VLSNKRLKKESALWGVRLQGFKRESDVGNTRI